MISQASPLDLFSASSLTTRQDGWTKREKNAFKMLSKVLSIASTVTYQLFSVMHDYDLDVCFLSVVRGSQNALMYADSVSNEIQYVDETSDKQITLQTAERALQLLATNKKLSAIRFGFGKLGDFNITITYDAIRKRVRAENLSADEHYAHIFYEIVTKWLDVLF